MKLRYIAVLALSLSLAACATTKQKPVAQTQPPVQQTIPAPTIERPSIPAPQPTRPAANPNAQASTTQMPPLPVGPKAGSVADFKYSSGEDRVYFGYNRYDLSPQARTVLKRQAGWLSKYPGAIVVIGGNADERGTREYNLALGARRADSVKAFLVSQGVNPGRITTVSYGKERPIDPRSNEAAWTLNRNARSVVLASGTS